jgi:radical SAM protein with 4Fe4S-binding SPASM domain
MKDNIVSQDEYQPKFENIGWTLGNACPYGCKQCYSEKVRVFGCEIEDWMIRRIILQLKKIDVKTVNLGGNEPIFTNGLNAGRSKLPDIIDQLILNNIVVGLTTAGISVKELEKRFPSQLRKLNDVDISIDSPIPEKHNKNRGANIFSVAMKALDICQKLNIEHTLVMCGMNWNLNLFDLKELLRLAKYTDSNLRINFLKPTDPKHIKLMPTAKQYYDTFNFLMDNCEPIEIGESLLASTFQKEHIGCSCGTKSFRIHSITPDGKIPISPCVYMHDYRVGDLCKDEISDIVISPEFKSFQERRNNPELIKSCNDCGYIKSCRGGCTARAYYTSGMNTLFVPDSYCLKKYEEEGAIKKVYPFATKKDDKILVHRNYLCTLIVKPI